MIYAIEPPKRALSDEDVWGKTAITECGHQRIQPEEVTLRDGSSRVAYRCVGCRAEFDIVSAPVAQEGKTA